MFRLKYFLVFESYTTIVDFKVNAVFLNAEQQKCALSLTISLSELIVLDRIRKFIVDSNLS